ncbi:hypothetical protein HBI56_054330 [Parastagonospora nodorum]|nr:hypothetical protein HBH56_097790 [Parastagonospora nodorum]KAH4003051.1 hypothetical protein HBI10_067320 [Parastagonospora nodorum]KAH4330751.1 hypothetical protein HBI00_080430 [Parastagonospora nodorum]KAH4380474.1 hypothetical protein HBH99_194300 [Parastagonospora nodorum]KAH4628280.1 hypothetical protein HBH55_107930 [Parastagonospora nodorum]
MFKRIMRHTCGLLPGSMPKSLIWSNWTRQLSSSRIGVHPLTFARSIPGIARVQSAVASRRICLASHASKTRISKFGRSVTLITIAISWRIGDATLDLLGYSRTGGTTSRKRTGSTARRLSP